MKSIICSELKLLTSCDRSSDERIMGRICSMKGCDSGRNWDVKRRKQMNLKQSSLFQVPKSENVRQAWSTALSMELHASCFVCENHFHDDDIRRFDKTVMPDRTVVTLTLDRPVLKKGAVPTINPEKCHLLEATTTEQETPMEIEESQHILENVPLNYGTFQSCSDLVDDAVDFADNNEFIRTVDINPMEGTNEEKNGPQDNLGFQDIFDDSDPENNSINNPIQEHDNGVELPGKPFTTHCLMQYLKVTPLEKGWTWMTEPSQPQTVLLVRLDLKTCMPLLHIKIKPDMSMTYNAPHGIRSFDMGTTVRNVKDVEETLQRSNEKLLCTGTDIKTESRARDCIVIVDPMEYKTNVPRPRCIHCRKLRQQLQIRNRVPRLDRRAKYAQLQKKLHLERRKNKRLREKAKMLKSEVNRAKVKCAAVEEHALMAAIANLPQVQQEAVKACFSAAKAVNSKRRRYTLEWVYECVLMRIKNGKLYEHIRSHNILPLPCKDTISKYIRKMDTAYGFQSAVFNCLKVKASRMEVADKRGIVQHRKFFPNCLQWGALLIDEMSLTESISVDIKTMKLKGFVDLGAFTPPNQQTERADHALVFMYQPFRGAWVQVLGAFLSKNSVTSNILHKLILECILLLNEAGFNVDVVTMDGAQWNRGVWTLFGIIKEQVSCEHPCDETRRLWMVSDFPHLIKCLRNGLMKQESFWTPDGVVMKSHWRALLDREGYTKSNLRIAYKLTPAHLDPKGYQKMSVPLAFGLFSDQVRIAMTVYKNDPMCPQLKTADATIKLCAIVNNLITAMMSRTPDKALRPDDLNVQKQAIQAFDRYLRNWETAAKAQKKPFPISQSTVSGLKVTLASSIELMDFLHKEQHFDYLLTARLNQDALERFFGMVRSACGCNDHPDPTLFSQVFRLLASYSLVKPPKGGNVTGTELLETLMETRESIAVAGFSKEEWFYKLDAMIEVGSSSNNNLPSGIESEHDYDSSQRSSHHHLTHHDYDVVVTSNEIQAYMAGYVARKIQRFSRCTNCIDSVQTTERTPRDQVIDLMNHYGGLTYPSDQLLDLITKLENAILDVVGKVPPNIQTLFQILEKVCTINNLPYVGCEQHYKDLTRQVLNFYIVTRGHFLSKSYNSNYDSRKVKSKILRKNSKL